MLRSLLFFVLAIIFSQPLLLPLSVSDSETGRPEDNFYCPEKVKRAAADSFSCRVPCVSAHSRNYERVAVSPAVGIGAGI